MSSAVMQIKHQYAYDWFMVIRCRKANSNSN